MVCPFCTSETKIYNSRGTHGKTQTWRRHRCKQCQTSFTTREKIDWNGSVSVKTVAEASTTPYDRDRLFTSLLRASDGITLPPGTLSSLCDTIEYQLQKQHFFQSDSSSANDIISTATSVLRRFNPNLALQYVNNVYRHQPPGELIRQIMDL